MLSSCCFEQTLIRLLAAGLVICASGAAAQSGAVTVRSQVLTAVEQRRWPAALAIVHRFRMETDAELQSDPDLFVAVATALWKTGNDSQAAELLTMQAGGVTSPALFALGTALVREQDYEPAIAVWERIPERDRDEAVWFNLGLAQSHLHQLKSARGDYFRAIDCRPGHIESYLHVGLDFGSEGKGRLALPWLLRASKLAPERSDIRYATVEQMIALGYTESARELLEAGKAEDTKSEELAIARGDLMLAEGDREGARKVFEGVLAIDAHSGAALLRMGRLARQAGQMLRAAEYLRSAKAADGGAAVEEELGELAAAEGERAKAIEFLKAACRLNCSTGARLQLARALRQSGRAAEALAVLPQDVEGPSAVAIHVERLQIDRLLGRPEDANREAQTLQHLQGNGEEALRFDEPKTYVQ